MKIPIFHKPSQSNSKKFTAQGYIKITSTSNKTNKMASKKYRTLKGTRAFPKDSTPHSKFISLFFELFFGPKKPETIIVTSTKPAAKPSCMRIGTRSE